MSALRRSPRLAATRASAPATTPAPSTTNLRRSRRLAGLSPAPPAPSTYTYIDPPDAVSSSKVAAAAIGRQAYRLYPYEWMAPDVADKELYIKLLRLTGKSMERIFQTGDNGRLRCLTKEEMVAWVNRESHILILAGMVRGWMHAPSGKWRLRNWTEEQVEIAMRQNPRFMETLEGAMK